MKYDTERLIFRRWKETEAPVALLTNTDPVKFGCSAVRNGNFYGRNLDLSINEI